MPTDFQQVISTTAGAFGEGLRFFAGKGMVNNALTKIVKKLNEHGIDYAVIGAVALNQYGYQRFTEDIDLLLVLIHQFANNFLSFIAPLHRLPRQNR